MYYEYKTLLWYFVFCSLVVGLLLCISVFGVIQKPELEKNSAYECGFNPFVTLE